MRIDIGTDMARRAGGKGKRPDRPGNVIHVAFGPGGGRLTQPPAPAIEAPAPAREAREPVTDLFSPKEVSKLLGVPVARLRALAKAEIVAPSGARGGHPAYTFQDLIALRATRELLSQSVRMKDVARAIGALRKTLPRVIRPLHELRIVSDGRRVVVREEAGVFEPLTGQMLLDFQVGALRDDVVRMLRPATEQARSRSAYDLYMRASSIDEDPARFDEAEKLYRRAIDLDPDLAIAYTNLGNILFRRGDEENAERLYRRALEVDDRQPEAHYNLGYVMLERGMPHRAVAFFQRALQADGRFADAHFNLAMALEALGEPSRAKTHWRRYLELEPTGAWADIARQHLA